MKKLITITLCLLMALSSLGYISQNVDAENSSMPFVEMSTGYPGADQVWDQEHLSSNMGTGPIGQSFSMAFAAQRITAGLDGDLIEFSVYIESFTGSGNVYYDIRSATSSGSSLIGGFQGVSILTLTSGTWNSFTLPAPLPLSSGQMIYLVLSADPGTNFHWRMNDPGSYGGGVTYESNNDLTWILLNGGSGDFTFRTLMEIPSGGLSKVAWHSNGEYAVAVTGFDDEIWKFTRDTGTWSSLGHIAAGAVYTDIVYDDFTEVFYFVGWKSTNNPYVVRYDGSGFSDCGVPQDVGTRLYGVEVCGGVNGYRILVTGEDGSDGYAAWYNGGWTEIRGGVAGWVPGEVARVEDATWNQRTNPVTSKHYLVGHDDESTGFVYELGAPGDTTVTRLYATYDDDIDWMNAISWNPGWAEGSQYDYAIMAGMNNEGWGNIWTFDGTNKPEAILTSSDTFHDVAWTTDGSMAVIVGEDSSGNGKVLHHGAGTVLLADMTSDLPQGTGPLFGIAYKGYTSPSSGIIVGASGGTATYPSASDSLTTITVNAAFPHMFTIDMWKTSDAGQSSTLNSGVDVETTYTFYTEINYTVSGSDELFDGNNNTFIDLLIWYDEGTEAGTPVPDDQHRTRYCVARWYETAGPGPISVTGSILYPTAPNEFILDSVGCSGPFGINDRYAVWMNITFGAQMRAADGNGFGNGASSNIYDDGQSHDDINSWNIAYTVFDNDYSGASNITYEEFGVNKLTNITALGNPGGNAPPGASDISIGVSAITCSANVPYYVNCSLPNLTNGGGDEIEATNIAIMLMGLYPAGFDYEPYTEINASWSATGRPFSAANESRMIWGNASRAPGNQMLPVPDNGTSAHGPWGSDFNGFGSTFVQWWASVPAATPEGIYTATITFEMGEF